MEIDGRLSEISFAYQLQEFMLTSVNFLMAESITHLQDIELKYLGEYSKFYTQIKI